MKWNVIRPSSVLAFFSFTLMAQSALEKSGPVGAGHEYRTPPTYLAPGEVVTLFVYGVPPAMSRAPADADLPTSLAGFSAGMVQITNSQLHIWQLPIQEVRLSPACRAFVPDCYTTIAAITVQVPFEMETATSGCGGCWARDAGLGVRFDEQASIPFEVIALPDRVHILKSFDSVLPITEKEPAVQCSPLLEYLNTAPANLTGLPCPPMVRHTDGSLVTARNPAKAGEELIAYAVGLGRTSPSSVTGQVVRSSSQTLTTFGLDFNFRRNALPTKPPPVVPGGDVPTPIYTGTLVGSVGLYEIRFRVPPVPRGTPPCADVDPRSAQFGNIVYSNLTVSVGGTHSFDGAGICVAVDAAASSPVTGAKQ